jgi:tetratricopeptide (TPR) repeat protein
MPEVLHALGLIDDMENAKFTIENRGQRKVIELRPFGAAEMMAGDTDFTWMPKPDWTDARGNSPAAMPLWLKDPQNLFWYEYLPESKTLYVQFNKVGNKENETIEAFTKRLFDFVDSKPVDRLVLDLRLNRGGNGTLNRPLLLGIVKSAKINQKGKLFTIIGRSTFSAAQFLVNDLEEYTNTLFVGEPSGSKGNIYGDSRRIYLPNSGITVRVSVYYWQDWNPWDTRFWTAPDLTTELTFEDYRLNNDPAMKTILNYAPRAFLTEALNEALGKGGVDAAAKRFREFMAEPVNRYAHTEQPLLEVGQRLLNEKKPEQALVLFQINAEENPHSFRAYFALGEAYFQTGKKELAVRNLEKALQMNSKSYDVRERLRQIKAS